MLRTTFKSMVVTLTLLIAASVFMAVLPRQAEALSGSDFQAGNIIDDGVFYRSNAMDPNQIQAFLNVKVPECDTNGTKMHSSGQTRAQHGASKGYPAPYTCLKDYSENTPNRNGEDGLCSYYSGGVKSGAKIIYDVAQVCGVSPKVLLVLLQKEQSLVTDDWPWSIQYRSATGYGCPDTAQCDSQYYGFFNQVYNAARIYKKYKRDPQQFNHKAFRNNNIRYNANTSCGSSSVYIHNQSTAGLYNYTPYQPNQALLSNINGSGDSCSAQGNLNFWRIFHNWFGSTRVIHSVGILQYSTITNEGGRVARLGFAATYKPAHPIEVRLTTSNPSEGSLSTSTVTIMPDTWDDPSKNMLHIKGLDDNVSDGAKRYVISITSVGSLDPAFDKMPVSELEKVNMINMDDEDSNVYRLFNHSTGRHYFTAVKAERDHALATGYVSEGTGFFYCKNDSFDVLRLSNETSGANRLTSSIPEIHSARQNSLAPSVAFSSSFAGTVPVYRLHSPSKDDYHYTISASERNDAVQQYGYVDQGVAFYACRAGDKPIYRLYRPSTGSHLYTAEPEERDAAQSYGYQYERVEFFTPEIPTSKPIYRLYRPSTGSHLYTADPEERNSAQDHGYQYERVEFYASEQPTNTSVYRLFRPRTGSHLYTADPRERDGAQNDGYQYERVEFTP